MYRVIIYDYLQGECIAKGTYQDLCRAGVDFMTLCEEEEDKDSAIEDNDNIDIETARPEFKREFSRRLDFCRQFSHQDSISPSEKMRDSSCHLSHHLSEMTESTISVTTQATEVSVYVSSNSLVDASMGTVILQLLIIVRIVAESMFASS